MTIGVPLTMEGAWSAPLTHIKPEAQLSVPGAVLLLILKVVFSLGVWLKNAQVPPQILATSNGVVGAGATVNDFVAGLATTAALATVFAANAPVPDTETTATLVEVVGQLWVEVGAEGR